MKLVLQFVDQKIEAADFEEKCRAMYSTSAYVIYTVDKLVQALVKQVASLPYY
jgi:histone deacetylase complex regulatory component SIN3